MRRSGITTLFVLSLLVAFTQLSFAESATQHDQSSQPSLNSGPVSGLVKVATRPGASIPLFWMPVAGATATVMLIPGGGGGFGPVVDGQPSGKNFLVRSRAYFTDQGFNVAVVGRPSDVGDLGYAYRTSAEHVGDLQLVVAAIRQMSAQPLWILGTSRGTVSAAAAAIAFGNQQLAGIVLTSSIVNRRKPGALPLQRLDAIQVPVLVLHHARDACVQCKPDQVQAIMDGLSNAPVKKLIMVDGGANPSGDPCGAQHWHGFVGMESEAADIIGHWIRKPAS